MRYPSEVADVGQDLVVVKLDRARLMLAQAKTAGEAKMVADVAKAAKVVAARQKLSREVKLHAHTLYVDAMTLAGELAAKAPKNKGSAGTGRPKIGGVKNTPPKKAPPTLAELGIPDKNAAKEVRAFLRLKKDKPALFEQVRAGATLADVRRQDKDRERRKVVEPAEDGCTVDDLDALIEQGKTFGTICADPPWHYGNHATRAAAAGHYGTMSVDEIAALPVAQLAAEESHLHLWTTNAFLPDAFRVITAWGFDYKSVFVWCKPQMGIGNYWRVSHEFLLLGTRGSCPFRDKGLWSWRSIDRGRHSAKPEQVYLDIEKAGVGPRLELFGREPRLGWTVWGNQIARTLFQSQEA